MSVYRIVILTIALAWAGWCLPQDSVAQTPDPSPPNILLILTDDQGWWDLGYRGNRSIETPVLDRLAAEGVDFNRFYAAPVCAPTRAGLMTGRYSLRTGLYNTRFGGDTLGLDEITIAQVLQQAGYRTGCFGKWHLGKYAPYQPHHRGFDDFLGHYHGHIDEYDYPDQLVHNGKPVEARRYVTDLFTDAAIQFIETNQDRPWFCYLSCNAPHSPFVVGTSHGQQERGDALIKKYLARDVELRDARIYAMIDLIDQNVGRLLDKLDQLNLSERTVVVFMTDNGGVSQHYSAGLRGRKASIYEGGVRVPLVVRWPNHFAAASRIEAQCSHVDLFPTFCELAGVQVPDDRVIDGKSLLPLLKAGTGDLHQPYVYHTWDRYFPNPDYRWSISDQRWKLACQVGRPQLPTAEAARPDRSTWQLFDLENDPGESKNLIQQFPAHADRLRTEFSRWFNEVTDGVEYQPVAIPVGHPDEPDVEVQPSWATWRGENTTYVFRGYDWDTIEGWNQAGDHATWKLDVLNGGRYQVDVSYGCSPASPGELRLSGIGRLDLKLPPTATPDVFVRATVGEIELKPGPAVLKLEVPRSTEQETLRLNRIWLTRIRDTN